MTKEVFISELRSRLRGLPEQDVEERVNFYSEMIDDRVEDGCAEEEAVSELGSVDEVVRQILSDYPMTRIVRESVRNKRRLRGWEIALLILGSPLWLPLLIAALAVILSLYIALWSAVISLWAAGGALALASVCVIVFAAVTAFGQSVAAGAAALGAGLFCIGISIMLIFACIAATKGMIALTKAMLIGVKTIIIGKGNAK